MKRVFPIVVAAVLLAPLSAQQREDDRSSQKKALQEEATDHYRRWVDEDVRYIITEEERKVFDALTTPEERDHFIEQFWYRRDPDPRTSINEYKEEFYRRIAYANEKFGSGIPGWKTDRGRTYITFGPPDIIEDHPSGGWYYRNMNEGGGATSTYPFQVWVYNYIDGIGTEVEVEFVDPSWSGEYRMALEPWEKDALLHVGFMGPTDAELEGTLSKLDRPYFSPGNYRNTKMQNKLGLRARDKPFERMLRFYQLQRPEPIQFDDLKQLVETQVFYEQLPFRLSHDHIAIDRRQVLVPVTLEVDNQNLTFQTDPNGESVSSQINIYGLVQSMAGRVVVEFDDTLVLRFAASELEERSRRRSTYQKILVLPPGRFKLTLVLQDDHSQSVGTRQFGLLLPALKEDQLDTSSVILARALQFVEEVPQELTPFVLGDFKVIPNVTRTFHAGDSMGVYLQVYNAAVDQATLASDLEVEYRIRRDGKIVKSLLDPKRNSVLDYGDRVLVLQAFPLKDLEPGSYQLEIHLRDTVGGAEASRSIDFSVTG